MALAMRWPSEPARRFWASEAARYYFLHKAVAAVAVPATAALVIARLSPVEQGFFFAMLSLLAFQSLGEFGFNAALMHFASHESGILRSPGRTAQQEHDARARLGALVRIAAAWTAGVAVVLALGLGTAGTLFLAASPDAGAAQWRLAWWLVCLALPAVMLSAAGRALAESCADVAGSQRSLLWATVAGQAVTWTGLLGGAGLLALGLGQIATGCVGLVMISGRTWPLLALARMRDARPAVHWRRDFWPHQWRIGLSWTCGLLMFQSFVPFVFHARGAAEAGQAGVLLQAFSLANVLGLGWVTIAQPHLGEAWARGDIAALRRERHALRAHSLWTAAGAAGAALVLVASLQAWAPALAERIGPLPALAWLMAGAIALQLANVDTAVVRFGKVEPFLANSVAGAALVTAANCWLAPRGLVWVFGAFAIALIFVVVPWVHIVCERRLAAASVRTTT